MADGYQAGRGHGSPARFPPQTGGPCWKKEIDVVHICTPHYLHTPMGGFVKNGHSYLYGKPPVISRGTVEKLKQAGKRPLKDGDYKIGRLLSESV